MDSGIPSVFDQSPSHMLKLGYLQQALDVFSHLGRDPDFPEKRIIGFPISR